MVNFQIHDIMDFDFEKSRLVSIVGTNGAGKTTLFDSFMWCLTGETTKGRTGDSIIKKKIGKNTMVSVYWEDDSANYLCISFRKHKNFADSRFLFKNVGNPFENPKDTSEDQVKENVKIVKKLLEDEKNILLAKNRDVLKFVEDLVMPKDILKNCLLFSQFSKKSFVEMSHSEQRDILDKLLLLDKYDSYYKNISTHISDEEEKIKDIINNINNIKSVISRLEVQKQNEKEYFDDAMKRFKDTFENVKKEYENIKEVIESLEKEKGKYVEVVNLYNELLSDQTKSEISLKNIKDDTLAKINEKTRELENEKEKETLGFNLELVSKKDKLKEEINNFNLEVSKVENEKEKTINSIDKKTNEAYNKLTEKYDKEINPLKDEINELISNLKYMKQEYDSLKKDIDEKEKELEEFNIERNKEVPVCKTCGTELTDKDSLKKLDNLIKSFTDNLSKSKNKIDEIKTKGEKGKETVLDKKDELKSLEEERDEKRKEIEDKVEKVKNKKTEELDNNINEIKEKILKTERLLSDIKIHENAKLRELHQKYEKLLSSEKEKIEKDSEELLQIENKKLEKIKSKLEDLREKIEDKERIDKELQKQNETKSSIREKLTNIKENTLNEKKRLKTNIENIETEIKENNQEITKKEKSIEKQNKVVNILKFWKEAFSDRGIKNLLLDETIPILQNKANDISKNINGIRVDFDSQSVISSGEFRNKFSVNAVHTSNLSELKEFSGGETRMVDIIVLLCLRHLLETMQSTRINILLLDEILDSLAPENASIIINVIKKLFGNYCIILISHMLLEYIEVDEVIQL